MAVQLLVESCIGTLSPSNLIEQVICRDKIENYRSSHNPKFTQVRTNMATQKIFTQEQTWLHEM